MARVVFRICAIKTHRKYGEELRMLLGRFFALQISKWMPA